LYTNAETSRFNSFGYTQKKAFFDFDVEVGDPYEVQSDPCIMVRIEDEKMIK